MVRLTQMHKIPVRGRAGATNNNTPQNCVNKKTKLNLYLNVEHVFYTRPKSTK